MLSKFLVAASVLSLCLPATGASERDDASRASYLTRATVLFFPGDLDLLGDSMPTRKRPRRTPVTERNGRVPPSRAGNGSANENVVSARADKMASDRKDGEDPTPSATRSTLAQNPLPSSATTISVQSAAERYVLADSVGDDRERSEWAINVPADTSPALGPRNAPNPPR